MSPNRYSVGPSAPQWTARTDHEPQLVTFRRLHHRSTDSLRAQASRHSDLTSEGAGAGIQRKRTCRQERGRDNPFLPRRRLTPCLRYHHLQTRNRVTVPLLHTPMNLSAALLPPLQEASRTPSFRDLITFQRQTLSDQSHPQYSLLVTALAAALAANNEKPVVDFYSLLIRTTIERHPPNVLCPTIQACREDFSRMRVAGGRDWRSSSFHRALEERNTAHTGRSTLSNAAGVRWADMVLHAFSSTLEQDDEGSRYSGDNAGTPPLASPTSDEAIPAGHPHLRIRSEPSRPVQSINPAPRQRLNPRPPPVRRTSPLPRNVEWRVAAMVADFKYGPPYFSLFCQVAAYLEQHHHRGGTFLGGVFRQDRFARVMLLRSKVFALEVTSDAQEYIQGQMHLITDAERNALDPETERFLELLTDLGLPFGRLERLEPHFDNTRSARISPPHQIGHVDERGAAHIDAASISALMDLVENAVELLLPMNPTAPLPVIPAVSLEAIGSLLERHFANAVGVITTKSDQERVVDDLRFKGKAPAGSATKQSTAQGGAQKDVSEDSADLDDGQSFDNIGVEESASNPDEDVGTWSDLVGDSVVVFLNQEAFQAVASGLTSLALSTIDPPIIRSSQEEEADV